MYTSRGNLEAEFFRSWSPGAVDRLYAQFRHHYYDHILFYRVVKGFVAQFGGNDSVRMHQWNRIKVPDEPVITGNARGTISFARDGKDSRDNDLFINLADNHRLDTVRFKGVTGFPVLGRITRGMETADSLYNGYGDQVFRQYDTLFRDKTVFLSHYPRLDSLIRVKIIRQRKLE
ncbi:MAG TPA: peptidylprolyl isomerase [Sediminibacterium sp.]|nr:peptidylprolyl isomerase [Sediminibacterium sp.]